MPSSPRSSRQIATAAFAALVIAYVGWMLSLPAWPSQDGPVHLYYTRVLDTLFSHSTAVYVPFFSIKHLLPPYAVYYYSLLSLSHVMPLIVADRVVICLYLVSFALGFRYAARAIGPGASRTAPLACALLLNWSLGMGFANYCLSLSFALWAIGLWVRFSGEQDLGRRCVFLSLLVMITLSHPVPLLIVLSYGGLDLVCRYLTADRNGLERAEVLKQNRANLVTLALGALCLIYVKSFTAAHPLEQRTAMQGGLLHHISRRAAEIATAKSVGLLYGHLWQVLLYRAGLVVLLLVPAVLAGVHFRRDWQVRRWTAASTTFVFLVLLAIALPILPSDLSGAYFFSERLTIVLWILALLAASAWEPRSAEGERAALRADALAVGFAMVLSVLVLHLAENALRPLAERDRQIAEAALPAITGQRTLVLAGTDVPPGFARLAPAWNPFQWDTVALLRRNYGILENAPWLDSPIIPLGVAPSLGAAWLPRLLANSPFELTSAMVKSPVLEDRLLSGAQRILISPVRDGQGNPVRGSLPAGWQCTAVQMTFVELCEPEANIGQ